MQVLLVFRKTRKWVIHVSKSATEQMEKKENRFKKKMKVPSSDLALISYNYDEMIIMPVKLFCLNN